MAVATQKLHVIKGYPQEHHIRFQDSENFNLLVSLLLLYIHSTQESEIELLFYRE